jgi:hypothetical protein
MMMCDHLLSSFPIYSWGEFFFIKAPKGLGHSKSQGKTINMLWIEPFLSGERLLFWDRSRSSIMPTNLAQK